MFVEKGGLRVKYETHSSPPMQQHAHCPCLYLFAGTPTANLGVLQHPFIWLERVLSGWEGCFNDVHKDAKDQAPNFP